MAGPSVDVERAPDGWTHIGGPSMHLLIALDEEDDRTLAASDAADGGDLDDVIEVLTAGGMRKARHFVGVHWKNETRIVAFGPVVATLTDADGTEREVRSTSSRVWTDLELDRPPEKVSIRVLDETELSRPVPPETLTEAGLSPSTSEPTTVPDAVELGAVGVSAHAVAETADVVRVSPATVVNADRPDVQTPVAQPADTPTSVETAFAAMPPTIPTFGARRDSGGGAGPGSRPTTSPWGRSWAQPESAAPTESNPEPTPEPTRERERPVVPAPAGETVPEAAAERQPSYPPAQPSSPPAAASPQAPTSGLPSWYSRRPALPLREPAEPVAGPTTPERVAPADRPVADSPVDVESTWRPAADPSPTEPPRAQAVPVPEAETEAERKAVRPVGAAPEANDPPSYDYLFGHTVAADEHRRFLADLEPADDEEGEGSSDVPSPELALTAEPLSSARGSGLSTPPNPAPTAAAAPLPTTTGGLISSVPWASSPPPASTTTSEPSAPSDEVVSAAPVPTFGGRRTPPPAPSLLPNNPPPAPVVSTSASIMVSGPPPVGVARPAAVAPPFPPARPAVSPAPAPTQAFAGQGGSTNDDGGNPDPGDHEPDEGLTIDRTALTEARNAASQSGESGPTVLAVLCSAGHPTPPHSERCRVCAAGIPAQDPFTMPRPALGVLRLSTGDVVSLDRSVLLGRAPKLAVDLSGTERPHVVKVPSPQRDVSRNHVEVVLEGWHVLIRDLGTTNGTTVAGPGDQPLRLRANDQQVLEPGSIVSMADEITFTFEAGEGP